MNQEGTRDNHAVNPNDHRSFFQLSALFLIDFDIAIDACYVYSENIVSISNDNTPILTVYLNANFSNIKTFITGCYK